MTAVQKGVLQIDASTPHAEVLVDEGFMGTTPLELKLDPGSHRVIIKKHGFQDWTRDVQIVDGGKQALWADLEEVSPPKTQEDGEQHKQGLDDEPTETAYRGRERTEELSAA